MKEVEDQFIMGTWRHQDLKLPADHDIQMFSWISLAKQNIPRIQVDNLQLGHQAIQFIRWKGGKKRNLGKQI